MGLASEAISRHNRNVRPIRPILIRSLALVAAALTTMGVIAFAPAPAEAHGVPSTIRPAADLSQFRPGNIISDLVFTSSSTMNAGQVQSFLESKVSACRSGYTCLKDFRQNTPDKGADRYCNGYSGVSNETASSIIVKVAQSCGINPQVLVVMLQKEQGLVTDTWPVGGQYAAAMGQACPDTAPCDPSFAGFFAQVYGGARQMKIYLEGVYFTWYAPGHTWNILYNPNTACGSSPVYVENAATSALYYYTPYQPNAAALAAGYGLGDSCSAYGNRNFYQYFTDWFGSTQIPGYTISKTASSADVYLVAGGSRWRIADVESYGELAAAYGSPRVISDATMNSFAYQGTTTSVLRNSSTGLIAIVSGGAMHRIPSCDLVAMWGSSCTSVANVPDALFSGLAAGDEAGKYFRVRSSTLWGRFDTASAAITLYDAAAAAAANGTPGNPPFAPYISQSRYASLTDNGTVFRPLSVVKAADNSKVYVTLDFGTLVWIHSWDEAAEYGVGPAQLITVPASGLRRYTQSTQTMAPTINCDGTTYFAGSGVLYRLANPATSGLRTMTASAPTCAQLPLANAAVTSVLAVKAASSSAVSVIEGGKQRPVLGWDQLITANGGSVPPVATVSAPTLAALPVGQAIGDGQLVKGISSPDVLLLSGANAVWVPSMSVATETGLSLDGVQTLPDAAITGFARTSTLGVWLSCGTQRYFAASGWLSPVTEAAAAGTSSVALSAAACAAFRLRSGPALAQVFVKTNSSDVVYLVDGGSVRAVGSWAALLKVTGGAVPQILVVSRETLSGFPTGAPIS